MAGEWQRRLKAGGGQDWPHYMMARSNGAMKWMPGAIRRLKRSSLAMKRLQGSLAALAALAS
jgi:hypothetical protein